MIAQPDKPKDVSQPVDNPVRPHTIVPLLDEAEIALLTLAASHKLIGSRIQRGRWDLAEVALSWSDQRSGIGRNIRVLFEPADDTIEVIRLRIDGNAWHDRHWPGGQTARQWVNRSESLAGRFELFGTHDSPPYGGTLLTVFEAVNGVSREDLARAQIEILEP